LHRRDIMSSKEDLKKELGAIQEKMNDIEKSLERYRLELIRLIPDQESMSENIFPILRLVNKIAETVRYENNLNNQQDNLQEKIDEINEHN
jgi:hypothetical protein